MSAAILIHGGSPERRHALARAVREHVHVTYGQELRVRVSSRAAEAAKCLADPAVTAVFLLNAPHDAAAVRLAAAPLGLTAQVYDLDDRDSADVVVSLIRDVFH